MQEGAKPKLADILKMLEKLKRLPVYAKDYEKAIE